MKMNPIMLFSTGDLTYWKGLPHDCSIDDLIKLFGNPTETCEETLGYYPALKLYFNVENVGRGLIAYERQQRIILIETKRLPKESILNELPEPDVILPNEILVNKAYAAEYVYSKIGLNLTVAQHFDKNIKNTIIRCRGFEIIKSPDEFDARYYKSFENSMLW